MLFGGEVQKVVLLKAKLNIGEVGRRISCNMKGE